MKPRIAVAVPEGTLEKRYRNYHETLLALGARPVEAGADVNPAEYDGLLLPGGWDIDPARYHRDREPGCGQTDPALDELQFAALDAFVRAGKPVFGICRGHQLINVFFGGTLIQDLPQSPRHKWDEVTDEDRAHGSTAVPGSWIAGVYGESFPVNSAHHQAADAVGEGLVVDQYSDDGIVEAMHHESLPVWCVQWHPERMCLSRARPDTVNGSAVIRYFIEKCGGSIEA